MFVKVGYEIMKKLFEKLGKVKIICINWKLKNKDFL